MSGAAPKGTDPFRVVRDFEAALCEYTGARFAVTTNSCTMALLLAMRWHRQASWSGAGCYQVNLPKRTYVGVAMSALLAGAGLDFRDEDWQGAYQLKPWPIWDAARRFTGGMYPDLGRTQIQDASGQFVDTPGSGHMACVSFHVSKVLGDSQGGAILHDSPEADEWLRRARFDGRTEGVPAAEDTFAEVGYHCYLSPDVAARLLWRLARLPRVNADLPRDAYPDLSKVALFR